MADLCPLTEMDPSGCAHCRNIPDLVANPTPARRGGDGTPGPAFPARYAGKCACGNSFRPGDQVRADGAGGWLAYCCDESIGDIQ